MSAFVLDTPLPVLVTLAAKATLLMALAAVAVLVGRRLSAAARHWTITLAICGLLGLPLLTGVLPSWTIATVPMVDGAGMSDETTSTATVSDETLSGVGGAQAPPYASGASACPSTQR